MTVVTSEHIGAAAGTVTDSVDPVAASRHSAGQDSVPEAAVVFSTVLAVTGLTRRQLDFWRRRGYVEALPGRRRSGRPRVFTIEEFAVIATPMISPR